MLNCGLERDASCFDLVEGTGSFCSGLVGEFESSEKLVWVGGVLRWYVDIDFVIGLC